MPDFDRVSTENMTAIRTMMTAMGVGIDHLAEFLVTAHTHWAPCPTVSEWVTACLPALSEGSARAYRTYWERLAAEHGHRPLTEAPRWTCR